MVDSNDKAELLNETFSAKQSNEDVVIPSGCHSEPHLTKFAFLSRDVKKILDSLDSWGGEDPDGFIPLIFKKMSSVLSPKLSRVYRHLFKNSLFSDERKIGNIAPVPKGALSADSNNYRPITILPVMSKVAEKLIFKPLYKYLEANAYLPSSQYAYRKKLGTCDALLDISSLVQENLDKGFETRIVQIDFSAAFDLVNHRALVYKLKELGIGGNLLNILKDFLHNRKQRVLVNGAASKLKPVISDVPQGSVLGPLLFLIYTADLGCNLENKLVQYADDSTLMCSVRSPDDRVAASDSLCKDLCKFQQWCKQWGMKLNAKKTKSLIVSRSRTVNPPHPQVLVSGCPIDNSDHLTILNSFILPCLEYCSPVWSSAADSHLKLLDRNLRACKFLIPNLTISLQHRRFISSLCMLYKIFHNPSHPLHSELPNLFHPRRVTRGSLSINSLSFSPMRFHTSQYSRCFIPATTKLWNELPSMIVEATELQKFKIGANAFLLGMDGL